MPFRINNNHVLVAVMAISPASAGSPTDGTSGSRRRRSTSTTRGIVDFQLIGPQQKSLAKSRPGTLYTIYTIANCAPLLQQRTKLRVKLLFIANNKAIGDTNKSTKHTKWSDAN